MKNLLATIVPALLLSPMGCLLPQTESLPGGDEDEPAAGADAAVAPPVDDTDAAVPVVDDGRVVEGLQALWKFEDGTGAIATDTGGVGEPLNLTIADPASVQWLADGALRIAAPTILTAASPPSKILSACTVSSEITIEAWIAPANVEQAGPARIVTYSIDTLLRNFTLAQDAVEYDARLRTTATDDNGLPATATGGNAAVVTPQHVVYTRGLLGARIYVDNVQRATEGVAGDMTEWDAAHTFALANEITQDRPWIGDLHMVAIYCSELTGPEVQQNFEAGLTVAAE